MTRLSQPLIALHSKKWFYLEEFYDRNYDGRRMQTTGWKNAAQVGLNKDLALEWNQYVSTLQLASIRL
jgi:hypothetical protein